MSIKQLFSISYDKNTKQAGLNLLILYECRPCIGLPENWDTPLLGRKSLPWTWGMIMHGVQWSALNLGDNIPRSELYALNLGHNIPGAAKSVRNPGHYIAWCAMVCPESEGWYSQVGIVCPKSRALYCMVCNGLPWIWGIIFRGWNGAVYWFWLTVLFVKT